MEEKEGFFMKVFGIVMYALLVACVPVVLFLVSGALHEVIGNFMNSELMETNGGTVLYVIGCLIIGAMVKSNREAKWRSQR